MTETMNLKQVLTLCEETHSGFFTIFRMKDKELKLVDTDFKGDVRIRTVAHIQTRGGDPRRAFEVGRQMADTSLLLVCLKGSDTLIADEKMKFIIE